MHHHRRISTKSLLFFTAAVLLIWGGILFFVLVLADPALAVEPGERPANDLPLPGELVWTLIAGAIVPLGGYVLNYLGPIVNEKVKGLVQVVLAAISGGLVQAITVGGVGLNEVTLQYVLAAVVAALFAHGAFYKPAHINTALGGGRNVQDNPAR